MCVEHEQLWSPSINVFFIPCRTPLHYAAGHVHYESVVLLVGSGCSVNKSDTKSCTALHYASAHDEDAKYDILLRSIEVFHP
jgi:ankyrin repeat protein